MHLFLYNFFLGKDSKAANETKTKQDANNDATKNDKNSNDTTEADKCVALGEIPRIEKYIQGTRVDVLQTLYQVNKKQYKIYTSKC